VSDERGEHLHFADAGAHGDSNRDGARCDDHPWDPRQPGAAGERSDCRYGEDDDPLDVLRERFGLLVAGEPPLRLGSRRDPFAGQQHVVDRALCEPADGLNERVARPQDVRAGTLSRRGRPFGKGAQSRCRLKAHRVRANPLTR
jgi:hypothetical protein